MTATFASAKSLDHRFGSKLSEFLGVKTIAHMLTSGSNNRIQLNKNVSMLRPYNMDAVVSKFSRNKN